MARFSYGVRLCARVQAGTANIVVDALSRKAELASISKLQGNMLNLIKESMEHDVIAKHLLRLAIEGKTKRF